MVEVWGGVKGSEDSERGSDMVKIGDDMVEI
jgi:hypothetical protein